MPPQKQRESVRVPSKLLNKSFYRFLFGFIAVVTGVLLFILLLGVGGGAV